VTAVSSSTTGQPTERQHRRWTVTQTRRLVATSVAAAGLFAFAAGPATSLGAAQAAPAVPKVPAAAAPAYGTLWVSSAFHNEVEEFAPGATGDATPIAALVGDSTGLDQPGGLAFTPQGDLWVDNFINASVEKFTSGSTGDVAPAATIIGPDTKLVNPLGVAVLRNGDIWVVDFGNTTLTEYAATASGDAAPIRTISGSKTRLSEVIGIAASPDGKDIWVTDANTTAGSAAVVEFSATATGNVKPLAFIAGSKTALDYPYGVTVGIADDPTVTNSDAATRDFSVQSYPAGANGNVKPTRVIAGTTSGLDQPTLIGMDAVGNVWVPNFDTFTVTRFSASQHGDAKPALNITGPDTAVSNPQGVTVYGVAPSAARAVHAHGTAKKLSIKWTAPASTGGGIAGYAVRTARKKNGHWTILAYTAKRSFTVHKPKRGRYYDVVAANEFGFAAATAATKPKV
jgi:NHL repeat